MEREPLLNYDELLAPIPGDEPAGPRSTFMEMRPQFEEMRKEVTAEQAAETNEEVKNADWRGLERKAKETLTESAKDLRIADYLLEALVKNYGFAGAHDGLKLLRLMTEQCWDRMHPENDPEDPEFRAGPYIWIDDPNLGLRLPTTLRQAPLLVDAENRAFSFYDCRPPGEARPRPAAGAEPAPDGAVPGRVSRLDIDRAVQNAPVAKLTNMLAEVQGCLSELTATTADLAAKLGAASPAMSALRTVFEECRAFLQQIIQQRPEADRKSDMEGGDGASAAPGAAGPAGGALSRDALYRHIADSARTLQQLEPHSPIPYLLLRAVELGMMPFPLLMQALIRDANVLTELKRELGIKDAPPPEG
jgi:type VI secretion system protein ImpA